MTFRFGPNSETGVDKPVYRKVIFMIGYRLRYDIFNDRFYLY